MEQIPNNTQNNEEGYDWKEYYELHADVPHTPNLEKAVDQYCPEPGKALDIGAGSLRDTKFLLAKGFEVTAVDPSPASFSIAEALNNPSLTFVQEVIGKWNFPEDTLILVNAEDVLFHFSLERLNSIFKKIENSLKTGGVFSGNFLGIHDEWNQEGASMSFLTKNELEDLFKNFDIKKLTEIEKEGTTAMSEISGIQKTKHWHMFRIIAVKK